MIYKTVPGPKVVSIKDGKVSAATDAFANIINNEARSGWIYHSMETITTQEKTGCFLNQQIINTNIYMLIFCREQ